MKNKSTDPQQKTSKTKNNSLFINVFLIACYGLVSGYIESLDQLSTIEYNDLVYSIFSSSIISIVVNFIIWLISGYNFEKFVSLWLVLAISYSLSFIFFVYIGGRLEATNVLSVATPNLLVLLVYSYFLE